MSSMSSLSKAKYTPNLNIFSLGKNKITTSKPKVVEAKKPTDAGYTHKSSDGGARNNLVFSSKEKDMKESRELNILRDNCKDSSKDMKETSSHSFRQSGLNNTKKFKTTKCSPEKNLQVKEKNSFGENKDLNFVKNSITSSMGTKNGISILGQTVNQKLLEEHKEESGLDVIAKKLKTSHSKGKFGINILNSTNPSISSSHTKTFLMGKINPLYPKESGSLKVKYADVSVSQSNTLKENTNSKEKIKTEDKITRERGLSSPRNTNNHMNTIIKKPSENEEFDRSKIKTNDLQGSTLNTLNKLSTSMKKIQSDKLNKSNQKNLTNPINMNKIINKITSNTESLLKDLKKKSESNQKFTDINMLNKNNNGKTNNQKISMTTPVTKKNSRKNSLEKALLKNILNEAENKNSKTNNLVNFNNKSSNFNKVSTKQNAKMSSGVNSNYITNNSNVSNNSGINLTNNSIIKGGGKYIFYKEINLVTDDSKKSQKVESDTIDAKSNNQPNTNFSNIKIYDISKNNFVKTPSAYLKKKNNFGNSLPITNKSSKTGSKNNSKSVSRIDEKIMDGVSVVPNNVAINISEINPATQKKSNSNINPNAAKAKINIGSSLPLSNYQIDKTGTTKKHLTSKNSPSHFPFNFSKDGGLKTQTKSTKKENPKEVAIQINKPIASLNLEKNKKTLTSLKASLEKDSLISTHPKAHLDKSNLIDLSMESGLNNSTSSVRSTVRESNYYKKEAEKITQFIKSHCGKYNEYPQSNLKFYKIGRLLGRGAFGKVNLGLHTASGRLVAIKSFNKSRLHSESARKKIYYETNLMKNLKHNSIVKIFEIIESPRYILIILEFVCGGDLLSFVRKRTKLNEQVAKFIFRQIIEALRYIHSQNIIHRDIKLDNILIDLNNTVKICDFGVGRQVQPGDVMHDQCGTPAYIAPEILLNEGYDGFGVDVWSAGVVLYAMLSGTVPFKANNMPDLHALIIGGTYNPIKDVSSEAISLLSGILQTDPKLRLTTEQILNHEWLRSTDEIFNGKIKSLNKLNLFANAERTVLIKSNIDYRNAHKDDLIENFTLKYLDTNQESENQNVGTKSHILAPFNSTIKHTKNLSNNFSKNFNNSLNLSHTQNILLIENDVIKFIGKAKEANRNYELNNNGEIDNGILINNQIADPVNNSQEDDINLNNNDIMREDKSPQKATKENSKVTSKQVSKPSSPPEFKNDFVKDDTNRNSRKNVKDLSITNTNTFIIDENVVKMCESIGYKKDYLMKCLYYNELNYATAAYYLFLNSCMD